MKAVLSPKELAQAIGVSESSVKRWVDDGAIDASRTAGGHRRIKVEDAIRFIRRTQSPVVRPELLGIPDLEAVEASRRTSEDAPERLYAALTAGRSREARGIILSLYMSGQTVSAICDGPVRSAMHRLGELWLGKGERGERGVYVEHRATDIVIEALNQLRSTFEPDGAAPAAVGGAIAGDPYLVPTLMASTVLSELGFRAINLGPHTPVAALRRAVIESEPRVCWLSVSVAEGPAVVRRELEELAGWLDEQGVRGIIGGRHVADLGLAPDLLFTAAGMGELAAFASGLVDGGKRG